MTLSITRPFKSHIGVRFKYSPFLFLSILLLASCAPAPRFTSEKNVVKNFHVGQTWTGKASWYGPKFHGRKCANGEIYDMNGVTAAHKQLPFGTILQVTNLKNGKKCNVRINDRGPYIRGRMLDLSKGAAIELDSLGDGVIEVRVKIVKLGGS